MRCQAARWLASRQAWLLRQREIEALDLWADQRGVTLDFSRPGKPTDNAFIEAFNGRFRTECLNAHWFMTLDDARTKLKDLAQILQRRAPAWRHRADFAA